VTRRVHLIRHADSAQRHSWNDFDHDRPLTETGRAQATALADLDVVLTTDVRSSPAVRCVGTVAPLADRNGVRVLEDTRLSEGADPREVVDWLSSVADDELVLCSHGDMIPDVLALLTTRGMTLDGPNACQKASVWTCVFEGDQPQHAGYRPPPLIEETRSGTG